ncbi:cytochrome P450 [Sphaerimonospora cavernae]|uniref:Cytochrome P450 n=1 Tax=Sphaerimonospora cavernae TaxID=1740611 RepID=A0ABV6TZ01_9ACTN
MTTPLPVFGRCPVQGGAYDLVDPQVHSNGRPHEIWRAMRAMRPVSWHPVSPDLGFWQVTKHDDVALVLRDYATFTSERGTMIDLLGTDDPAGGSQLAVTDPPRHGVMRAPLQQALTLKAVEHRQHVIQEQVESLLRPLQDGGVFDFADAMLGLPMAVTGVLMGLPTADWKRLTRLTTVCIAPDDPEYRHPRGREHTLKAAHRELFAYFQDIVKERERNLGDDLISVLLRTEFDGRRMSTGEIVSNCYSMLLGANVTTPHAPSFALVELLGTERLDDWAAHPELVKSGVEEALRWASPITYFMRYATKDTEIRGVPIASGDAVVAWIASANRDEEAFDNPFVFDIRRKPNRHIAFGAGPHHCVGHMVARVTLRLLFTELFSRFRDLAPAGRAERLQSNFVSGYKHLPITARLKER